MVSRVFHPRCSPAIHLLWRPPCSHSGWQHVGTSSSVETGLSSRMGHLEKEKLSPGLGPAGWAPSWLCTMPWPLAGGWQGLCCTCPQLGARSCSGGAARSSSFPGGSSAQSPRSSRGSGHCCCGSGVARPQGCARSCAAMESRSRGAQSRRGAGRAGGSRAGAQGGRGCPGQAVPGRKQPVLGFPWVPALVVPLWSPAERRSRAGSGGPCGSPGVRELLPWSGGAASGLTQGCSPPADPGAPLSPADL